MHQFDKLEMEVFSTAETGRDEGIYLLIALQGATECNSSGVPYTTCLWGSAADIGRSQMRVA